MKSSWFCWSAPHKRGYASSCYAHAAHTKGADGYAGALADHPYHGGWPDLEVRDRSGSQEEPLPGALLVTTARYGGVANDEDQSDSKHLYTCVPSTNLCTALNLQRLDDFRRGRNDTPLAESFAARQPGPDSVHVRLEPLRDHLLHNGQTLLWTVLADKHTTFTNDTWPRDGRPLMRSYSATYLYDGTSIKLVGATARTLQGGGRVSPAVPWTLPTDIPIP